MFLVNTTNPKKSILLSQWVIEQPRLSPKPEAGDQPVPVPHARLLQDGRGQARPMRRFKGGVGLRADKKV